MWQHRNKLYFRRILLNIRRFKKFYIGVLMYRYILSNVPEVKINRFWKIQEVWAEVWIRQDTYELTLNYSGILHVDSWQVS
jgi:hypothetical protein